MSEPTRYRVANNQAQLTLGGGILAVEPAGPLVMYDDYARLHSLFANSEQENARLKAEVERLRKAGDALADKASLSGCSECFGMFNDLEKSLDEWNAAKEGKQS